MNPEEIQIRIDLAIDKAATATTIKDLNKAIKELKNIANEVGPEAGESFRVATEAAAEFKDQITDLNENIKAVTGDSIEKLTGSFGQLKDGLLSLDFDKATAGASNLAASINNFNLNEIITKFENFKLQLTEVGNAIGNKFGPAAKDTITGLTKVVSGLGQTAISAIGGSFKGAIQGLGTAFQGLGQIIKANPLLLLATTVMIIVANFEKLKNVGGALGAVFQGIGRIVDGVTKAFTDLTDAIGLTDIAGQKMAENRKKQSSEYIDYLDKEIARLARLQATGAFYTQFTSQDRVLERENELLKEQNDLLEIRKKRELTEEEQQKLKDKEEELYMISVDRLTNNVNNYNKIKEAIIGGKELELQDAERNKNQRDYFNTLKDIKEIQKMAFDENYKMMIEDLRKSKEGSKMTQKQLEEKVKSTGDYYKMEYEYNAKIRKYDLDAENFRKGIEDDRKKREEEARNDAKKTAEYRLSVLRDEYDQISDNDDIALEDKAIKLKAQNDKIVEFYKEYKDTLQLSQLDFNKAIREINQQNEDWNKKVIESKLEEERLGRQVNLAMAKNLKERTDAEKAIIIASYNEKLALVKAGSNAEKLLKEQMNAELLAIDAKYYDQIASWEQARLDAKADVAASAASRGFTTDMISALNADFTAKLNLLNSQEQIELERAAYLGKSKEDIENEFRARREELEKQHENNIYLTRLGAWQKGLALAQNFTNALSGLNSAYEDYIASKRKSGEKATIKEQKAAFRRQKALSVLQTQIATAQAVMTTLATPGIDPITKGIMAGAVGAMGAVQVALIAAKKFNPESDEGGSSGGSVTGLGPLKGSQNDISQSAGAISQPMLYGLNNPNASNIDNSLLRVVLVESDVTGMQNKIKNIESGSYITRKR